MSCMTNVIQGWILKLVHKFALLIKDLFMYIMIKHHWTEQQSYAIMVTHHIMHYDNPPLYYTHILWEHLGLSLIHNEAW